MYHLFGALDTVRVTPVCEVHLFLLPRISLVPRRRTPLPLPPIFSAAQTPDIAINIVVTPSLFLEVIVKDA